VRLGGEPVKRVFVAGRLKYSRLVGVRWRTQMDLETVGMVHADTGLSFALMRDPFVLSAAGSSGMPSQAASRHTAARARSRSC